MSGLEGLLKTRMHDGPVELPALALRSDQLPDRLPAFEEIYLDALRVLETHFTTTPYLFGGLPSMADFSLMGPLFGHLARDPVPATLMKQRAPRVSFLTLRL